MYKENKEEHTAHTEHTALYKDTTIYLDTQSIILQLIMRTNIGIYENKRAWIPV